MARRSKKVKLLWLYERDEAEPEDGLGGGIAPQLLRNLKPTTILVTASSKSNGKKASFPKKTEPKKNAAYKNV